MSNDLLEDPGWFFVRNTADLVVVYWSRCKLFDHGEGGMEILIVCYAHVNVKYVFYERAVQWEPGRRYWLGIYNRNGKNGVCLANICVEDSLKFIIVPSPPTRPYRMCSGKNSTSRRISLGHNQWTRVMTVMSNCTRKDRQIEVDDSIDSTNLNVIHISYLLLIVRRLF